MNDTVMTHERKGHQHLACEAANKGSGKAHKAICLDQLIQIDTEEFHSNAKVVSEVEMLSHLDDVVLLVRILQSFSDSTIDTWAIQHTHFRKLSRILISTRA